MADGSDGQIPLPIMGMTPKEYQAAFMYLDHANFAREMEEIEEQQRRTLSRPPESPPWYRRYEFWAIVLGAISLGHAVFIQWVWPIILRKESEESPYGSGG